MTRPTQLDQVKIAGRELAALEKHLDNDNLREAIQMTESAITRLSNLLDELKREWNASA
jgi:hypothetical protein